MTRPWSGSPPWRSAAFHLIQQVRRQHDGLVLAGQAGDLSPGSATARWVEAVHRLVQDEQVGVGEQARRGRPGAAARRFSVAATGSSRSTSGSFQRRGDPGVRVAACGGHQGAGFRRVRCGWKRASSSLIAPIRADSLAGPGRGQQPDPPLAGVRPSRVWIQRALPAPFVPVQVAERGAARHEREQLGRRRRRRWRPFREAVGSTAPTSAGAGACVCVWLCDRRAAAGGLDGDDGRGRAAAGLGERGLIRVSSRRAGAPVRRHMCHAGPSLLSTRNARTEKLPTSASSRRRAAGSRMAAV